MAFFWSKLGSHIFSFNVFCEVLFTFCILWHIVYILHFLLCIVYILKFCGALFTFCRVFCGTFTSLHFSVVCCLHSAFFFAAHCLHLCIFVVIVYISAFLWCIDYISASFWVAFLTFLHSWTLLTFYSFVFTFCIMWQYLHSTFLRGVVYTLSSSCINILLSWALFTHYIFGEALLTINIRDRIVCILQLGGRRHCLHSGEGSIVSCYILVSVYSSFFFAFIVYNLHFQGGGWWALLTSYCIFWFIVYIPPFFLFC